MSSGPEGETMPSRPGRLDDGIGSDACVMQAPLDVAGGSIHGNARSRYTGLCRGVPRARRQKASNVLSRATQPAVAVPFSALFWAMLMVRLTEFSPALRPVFSFIPSPPLV